MVKKIAQKYSTGNTGLLSTNLKVKKPENWKEPKKSRLFQVTDYVLDESFYMDHQDKFSYVLMGLEQCPSTKRTHWQGYVRFCCQKTNTSAQKFFNPRHCEMIWAGETANYKYCKKDGNVAVEIGLPPLQGQRMDLVTVRDRLNNGEDMDDMITEDPYLFHMYGRTMMKLEDIKFKKNRRTEATQGVWFWGPTMTGKSHRAFEGYYDNPSKFYNKPKDGEWWDDYKQQEIVIINEYRGDIKYDVLLEMLDHWPIEVRRRNRTPIPFTSKKIIITSALSPEECYHNRAAMDSIEQLLRRLTVVHLTKRYIEGPLNDWFA